MVCGALQCWYAWCLGMLLEALRLKDCAQEGETRLSPFSSDGTGCEAESGRESFMSCLWMNPVCGCFGGIVSGKGFFG